MQNYHMRTAPKDPLDKKKGAKIGDDGELYNPQFGELKPRVMKERMHFAGGFKIMEGSRKPKEVTFYNNGEGDEEGHFIVEEGLTKDDVLQQLGLQKDSVEQKIEDNRQPSNTSSTLRSNMVEDLSKELSRLKRKKEGIERQKELMTTGEIKENETIKEKGEKIKTALENEIGANVLHAEPERIQFQRHQTGQLGGIGEYTLIEIQELRKEAQQNQNELEDQYWKYRSAKQLGSTIMDKFFPNIKNRDEDGEFQTASFKPSEIVKEPTFKFGNFDKENAETKLKKHKSKPKFGDRVKPYYMQGVSSKSEPKIGKYKRELEKENQANNATKEIWNEEPFYMKTGKPVNSRDAAYEAKFKRYLYNKHRKGKYDEQKDRNKKREYDTWMHGPESPHKDAK